MPILGKVLGGAAALTLGLTAVVYSGGSLVDGIKSNIDRLEDRILLTADEAASAIGNANIWLEEKNNELDRYDAEVTRLNSELDKANTEIETGKSELTNANASIEQANADMEELANFSQVVVDRSDNDGLVWKELDDNKYQIVGQKLVFTVVQNQDEANERTLRLSNPNSVDVSVKITSTNGSIVFDGMIAGGDVRYFKKNNNGEMLKLSYTIPGTETAILNTK